MTSYFHKELAKRVLRLDTVPDSDPEFEEWLKKELHVEFLRQNALEEELVVYCSSALSFIHSVVVSNDMLTGIEKANLLNWSSNPYTVIASYCSGGGRPEIWVDRTSHRGHTILDQGTNLIFGRTFEGWSSSDRSYFEVNQEYAHLNDIHYRSEHSAYCRYNETGDLEESVSLSVRGVKQDDLSLVTFRWEQLEEYLAISNATLIRMFDFTLARDPAYVDWPHSSRDTVSDEDHIAYERVRASAAVHLRGIQFVGPRRPPVDIMDDIKNKWSGFATTS